MQWFDAIMTFAIFGGSAAGLIKLQWKKEENRHRQWMNQSERDHDYRMAQIRNKHIANEDLTLGRVIRTMINPNRDSWQDKEY